TSLEALTQSLFAFREAHVSCAIYYEGWNDLRNAHMADLKPDYSTYEVPHLERVLLVGSNPGFLQRNSLALTYLMSLLSRSNDHRPLGYVSGEKDLRLSKIYRDNMRLVAAIGQSFGVSMIFIPQVVNNAALSRQPSDSEHLVQPYIRSTDMIHMIGYMNQDLAEAAAESNSYFLGAVEAEAWSSSDFVDQLHFSAKGSLKFAKAISDEVRKICN